MNFEMEVMNILEMRHFELTDEEKIPIIKNWQGQEGLLLIKTFSHKEKEKCRTTKAFLVVINRFKLWHNRVVISLQYQTLCSKNNKSAQRWMGRLWTKTT